jgi:hypothetical protein
MEGSRKAGGKALTGCGTQTACTAALMLGAACGVKTDIVASKYVRSQFISAAQGGTLTVTAADSPELAGTRVEVPPGALAQDSVITVGPPGNSTLVPVSSAAGPLVDLGPEGITFDPSATVTLPFSLPDAAQTVQLVVDVLEGDGTSYQIGNAQLAIDGGSDPDTLGFVSFAVSRFSRFEPDVVPLDAGLAKDAGDGGPIPDAGCPAGMAACPSGDGGETSCVDLTSDSANCGACAHACPAGAMCIAQGLVGTCICDTSVPDGGDLLYCAFGCVHTDSDPLNCGMCNNQCETRVCNGGNCLCDPDAGIVSCSPHSCVNLNINVQNCGACGNDCTLGGALDYLEPTCNAGQCACAGGQKDICFSAASFPDLVCISTTSDPNNCGGCGLSDAGPLDGGLLPPSPHVCSAPTKSCVAGTCVCPNGLQACPAGGWITDAGTTGVVASCIDQNTDSFNCGACAHACETRYAAGASCQYAKCSCAAPSDICVVTNDPLTPACDCSGSHDGGAGIVCGNGLTLSYSRDIFPLLANSTVSAQPWGVLVGCSVSGCHDQTAAGGLSFGDVDASYLSLYNAPSQICAGQSLTIAGNGPGSLLTQLLGGTFSCPNPIGGIATPMPINDAGTFYPLSPCLVTQIREWIDQGMPF